MDTMLDTELFNMVDFVRTGPAYLPPINAPHGHNGKLKQPKVTCGGQSPKACAISSGGGPYPPFGG